MQAKRGTPIFGLVRLGTTLQRFGGLGRRIFVRHSMGSGGFLSSCLCQVYPSGMDQCMVFCLWVLASDGVFITWYTPCREQDMIHNKIIVNRILFIIEDLCTRVRTRG